MPNIRDYPQALNVLQTDAFLIDRIGTGTMYVEEGSINSNSSPISLSVFDTGAADKTVAFNDAFAYLVSVGGGVLYVPPGNWKCNIVITNSNILISGNGGNTDNYTSSLSPYDITKPCVTFSDGTITVENSGLSNIAIDGSDKSVNGRTKAANNCPQALLIKGGTTRCTFDNIQIYNGIVGVDLEPSVTAPVTGNFFTRLFARNDITDSASARCIKSKRLVDPGYNTANYFSFIKTNNGAGFIGYAIEVDGDAHGINFHLSNSYLDVLPLRGILLRTGSSAQIWGWDNQIDPGASGVVVVTVTGAITDLSRLFVGFVNIANQQVLFQTGPTTVAVGDESLLYSYRQRIGQAWFWSGGGPVMRFTPSSDPGDAGDVYPYIDFPTNNGPVRFNRMAVRHTQNPEFYNTNTTGAGAALLGANCPAVTAANPYTWIAAKSSDGSTVYIPAWK